MISIKDLAIIVGIISTGGGAIITFVIMQVKQNNKIENTENKVKEIKDDFDSRLRDEKESNEKKFDKLNERHSNYAHYQMKLEKDVLLIKNTITHISEGIDELKEIKNK